MNPNDLIAQQQAILNQTVQSQQYWAWGIIAFQIACTGIGALILYLFYARLRDIAEELRKIRISYQDNTDRDEDRRERLEALQSHPTGNPSASASGDNKYQPRP